MIVLRVFVRNDGKEHNMKIPRQFLGVNYISKIVDNFQDHVGNTGTAVTFHEPKDCKDVPLEKAATWELSLNAAITTDLIRKLACDPNCALDGLAVCKGESLLFEAYRTPYSDRYPHITNSTCKTITAIAVMFAISEHLLTQEDYVLSFFPEYDNLLTPKHTKKLTIYHLLTMTSCSKCNEIVSVTDHDWVRAFLTLDCQYEPGSRYIYNSMNTYMLAAILNKVTGMSLVDYLTPRLFKPLGIGNIRWELCPKGIERGGWGLHLSLDGMLKIGIFLANDGAYHGKQLIKPAFIKEMKRVNIHQDADALATGYGYQIWHLPGDLMMLSGMFGQHVIFSEDTQLVVAMNAHNDKMFPDSVLVKHVIRYMKNPQTFQPDGDWKERLQYRHLLQVVSAFQKGYSLKNDWNLLQYHTYCKKQQDILAAKGQKVLEWCRAFDGKRLRVNTETMKLFPYMLQGLYSPGPFSVSDISFKLKETSLKMCFYKERNRKDADTGRERIELEAGADAYCIQQIPVGGNRMDVAVKVTPATDEDEHKVILLDIIFLEEGIHRRIKFFLFGEKVAVELAEYPDMRAIVEQVITGDAVIAGNTYDIADKIPEGFRVLLEHKVEPKIYATLLDLTSKKK